MDYDQALPVRLTRDFLAEPVVATAGTMLTGPPELLDTWWAELRVALAALAVFRTLRVCERQELITRRSARCSAARWTPPSPSGPPPTAICTGGNVTAPGLYLLDWADWGLAPRGNDAACLWGSDLAVPDTAERVHAEFRDDLDSRSERIARLWVCSNILRMAERRADARQLAEPATVAAGQLVKDLR